MADYIRELNNILSSTGRKVIDSVGTISHKQAHDKSSSGIQKIQIQNFLARLKKTI
ncbi:MAG: hypothetical protein ACRC9X_07900 [Bacteroidales bacterium]